MAQSRHEGDLHIAGALSCKTLAPPAGSIGNTAIAAAAGIAADKLEHQHRVGFAQPNTTAADEERVVYVCYGATGSVIRFEAGSIVAAIGDSTVTVDLHKNGTTVLSAPITLNSSSTAYVVQTATISAAGLAVGDVLEVVVDATVGTGTLPTGVFAALTVHEDAD